MTTSGRRTGWRPWRRSRWKYWAGVLGQRAVEDLDRGARAGEVLDRCVAGARPRVEEGQVALAERAALGVLPGEAHGHAIAQQRGQGEAFGLAPIERPVRLDRSSSTLELPDELGVERETVRDGQEGIVQLSEPRGS